MTDLERQWDELPVRPAPVDRILRDAHREKLRAEAADAARQPAPRLRRSVRRTALLGGIAAAFVAGTLVTQPGDRGQAQSPGQDRCASERAALSECIEGSSAHGGPIFVDFD